MKNFKISLAWQILIALILGVVVGAILHNQPEIKDAAVNNVLKPLGQIFISLIKMIVIPIVFLRSFWVLQVLVPQKVWEDLALKQFCILKSLPRLRLLSV
jgi:L-cystine uptake protein TcyP (sodium:dicarboxylate symporter family)